LFILCATSVNASSRRAPNTNGSAGVAEGLHKALTQTRTGASDYRDVSVQAEPVDDRHGWSG
jgi:hypothetical protein